ncbi:hypothetical protein, partial [Treponema primitia]|uniref:hypothetical protein n=1 Tax=Treponema primitia TaxID=88058 RepID=UPI0002554FCC
MKDYFMDKEMKDPADDGLEIIGMVKLNESTVWGYYVSPLDDHNIHVFESLNGGPWKRESLYQLENFFPPLGFEPTKKYEELTIQGVVWPVCHGWKDDDWN